MILTSPTLLVEGVRSGSRKRNAATASPLAGGGAGPESRRTALARAVARLCSRYAGYAGRMCSRQGEPGYSCGIKGTDGLVL